MINQFPNEHHYFIQIVVVPDAASSQKLPPVPGLLEYRKDTKKFYVRSNDTWNAIGEEEKVTWTVLLNSGTTQQEYLKFSFLGQTFNIITCIFT